MKTIIISIFMAMMAIAAQAQQKSFYDFTVKTIDGKDLSLSSFKGKKVLVVNVASKCGFTPQYAKLEELYTKYGKDNFGPNRYHIVTAKNSFHGRTLATLAATGQPGTAIQRNYDPMIPGFSYAEFNNVQAFADACTDDTIAIMVEPVQGEGGVIPATKEFLQGLRKLCDERNMLLLFDEVQTGWGRTGSPMAFMGYGVKPDCVTMAKAMGGGMPIGAMCTSAKLALTFGPGAHGSTYAGNPVACAASYAQIGEIIDQKLPENADKIGAYFREELLKLPCVKEVRGRGLMVGVEFNKDIATDVKYQSADEGLLITAVRPNVIRLVPPLNITEKECDEAFAILHKVVSKLV